MFEYRYTLKETESKRKANTFLNKTEGKRKVNVLFERDSVGIMYSLKETE